MNTVVAFKSIYFVRMMGNVKFVLLLFSKIINDLTLIEYKFNYISLEFVWKWVTNTMLKSDAANSEDFLCGLRDADQLITQNRHEIILSTDPINRQCWLCLNTKVFQMFWSKTTGYLTLTHHAIWILKFLTWSITADDHLNSWFILVRYWIKFSAQRYANRRACVVFCSTSRKILGSYLNMVHGCFLPQILS